MTVWSRLPLTAGEPSPKFQDSPVTVWLPASVESKNCTTFEPGRSLSEQSPDTEQVSVKLGTAGDDP